MGRGFNAALRESSTDVLLMGVVVALRGEVGCRRGGRRVDGALCLNLFLSDPLYLRFMMCCCRLFLLGRRNEGDGASPERMDSLKLTRGITLPLYFCVRPRSP